MIDAASYGRALFQLAEENGCGDGVLEELQLVRRALRENPGYVTLMDTPAVAGPEKHALLLQAFSGASQELRNFLCLLCDRTCRTDPTLLGGITLRYGGIQLDDSIRSRLERLRRSLSQTVV